MSGPRYEDEASAPTLNASDMLNVCAMEGGPDLVGQRNRFMGRNELLVDHLLILAGTLQRLEEGELDTPPDVSLPEIYPAYSNGAYPGSSRTPVLGVRLTLDHQVKTLTGHEYFVHNVDPIGYEEPDFLQGDLQPRLYVTFGLVPRLDDRDPEEFDPSFAVAFSPDCREARIIRRLPEDEISNRRKRREVEKLAGAAWAGVEGSQRRAMAELRGEVRRLMLNPRLSEIGNLALIEILGEESVIGITAAGGETEDLLESESVPINEPQLHAARIVLSSPKAFDPGTDVTSRT